MNVCAPLPVLYDNPGKVAPDLSIYLYYALHTLYQHLPRHIHKAAAVMKPVGSK